MLNHETLNTKPLGKLDTNKPIHEARGFLILPKNYERETMFTHESKYSRLTYLISALIFTIAMFGMCQPAAGQRIKDVERATLVSSEKIKASTNFLVCVVTESGKRISFKYNSHCWNCRTIAIPVKWDVIYTRKKAYIKPQI